MSVQDQQTEFERLKDGAENGRLPVVDVFNALRQRYISESECTELLTILEKRNGPTWKRILAL
jgi:hypothetical protein